MADTEKMCLVVHRRCAFVNPWLGWGIDLHSYRSILQTFSVTPDSLSIPWSGWQLLISSPPTWNHTCVSLLHRWLEERRKWSCSVVSVCDPMGRSLPGSSVRGIFQARILEWVAISFSRGSSQPRDQTRVSCAAGRLFAVWATREAHRWLAVLTNFCPSQEIFKSW